MSTVCHEHLEQYGMRQMFQWLALRAPGTLASSTWR